MIAGKYNSANWLSALEELSIGLLLRTAGEPKYLYFANRTFDRCAENLEWLSISFMIDKMEHIPLAG